MGLASQRQTNYCPGSKPIRNRNSLAIWRVMPGPTGMLFQGQGLAKLKEEASQDLACQTVSSCGIASATHNYESTWLPRESLG